MTESIFRFGVVGAGAGAVVVVAILSYNRSKCNEGDRFIPASFPFLCRLIKLQPSATNNGLTLASKIPDKTLALTVM